jgi:hypothetical protein
MAIYPCHFHTQKQTRLLSALHTHLSPKKYYKGGIKLFYRKGYVISKNELHCKVYTSKFILLFRFS